MNPNTQILLHCNETITRLADNWRGVHQAALHDSNIPWQFLQSNLKFWRFKATLSLKSVYYQECFMTAFMQGHISALSSHFLWAQINRKTTMWLSLDPSIEAQWLHGEKHEQQGKKKRQEKSSHWSQYIVSHWLAIKSHCPEHMFTLLGGKKNNYMSIKGSL